MNHQFNDSTIRPAYPRQRNGAERFETHRQRGMSDVIDRRTARPSDRPTDFSMYGLKMLVQEMVREDFRLLAKS